MCSRALAAPARSRSSSYDTAWIRCWTYSTYASSFLPYITHHLACLEPVRYIFDAP